jgi:hypothetical protein
MPRLNHKMIAMVCLLHTFSFLRTVFGILKICVDFTGVVSLMLNFKMLQKPKIFQDNFITFKSVFEFGLLNKGHCTLYYCTSRIEIHCSKVRETGLPLSFFTEL